MPNTDAARKTVRQDAKRRLRNRITRSTLRTLIKKYRDAVAAGDAAIVETTYRLVAKRLDQAAAKHKIHKNKAARLKSRLALLAQKKPQATA